MEQPKKSEHQIDQATRTVACLHDVNRLRLAEELRMKLFRRYWHHQISDRAYELWQRAGHPMARDLEFWLAAEREIKTGTDANL